MSLVLTLNAGPPGAQCNTVSLTTSASEQDSQACGRSPVFSSYCSLVQFSFKKSGQIEMKPITARGPEGLNVSLSSLSPV